MNNNFNAIESKIYQIWKKIIGEKSISLDDDFLDVGATSLQVITMVAEISKLFSIEVDLEVLEETSIKQISKYIERKIASCQ